MKYTARVSTHLCVSGQYPMAAATCCEYNNGALESGNFLTIFEIVTFSSRVPIHTLRYMEVKPALQLYE
jgi:hypothetical protein